MDLSNRPHGHAARCRCRGRSASVAQPPTPWIPSPAGGCTPAWSGPPLDHVYARTVRDCKYIIDIIWLPMACTHAFFVHVHRIIRCDLGIEDDVTIMPSLAKSWAARPVRGACVGGGGSRSGGKEPIQLSVHKAPIRRTISKPISIGMRIFGDDPPDVRVRERDGAC